MTHLSPAMRAVEPYPFEELDRRKKDAFDAGRRVIDFGVGDPREETPALVRDALKEAIGPISSYPRAAGLPPLRGAIAAWAERRYGARLDADTQILPTLGSKELVFSLAQAVLDPAAGKDLVLTTAPGYPIPERGARYAGGDVARLRLTEERGFLPDLDAIADERWSRASVLWLNYPNNPTGAVAPLSFLADAAERCRAHDVLLASDEAYSELWFGEEAPPGALQLGDLSNVLVLNTLSKRSSMTGYRSGFAAGDPTLIAALRSASPRRSSCSARASRPGATSATSRRTGRATRPSGPCSWSCSLATASTSRGARPRSICGSQSRPSARHWPGRWSCWTAPTSSWRPGRSSDRRARATSGWPWCPRWTNASVPPP